ncbi:MAG: ABC transporter ATP-binding protein [Alkalispirochaeta sp.]
MKHDQMLLTSVWRLLERSDRWRLVFLVIGILLTSALNIGGVASIMPLIELLTSSSGEIQNQYLRQLFDLLGVVPSGTTIVWLGISVLLLFVIGNAALAFVTWKSINFARMVAFSLSSRMFDIYLRQEYSFFLVNNSSDLIKNLFGELNSIVNGVLRPLVELLVEGILAVTLVVFLILVHPQIAIFTALLLGGGYGLIFFLFRTVLNRASRAKVRRNKDRYRIVGDAFGAIKEIKLMGLERSYSERYDYATYRSETAKARIQGVARLPRYVLETVAFGGILGLLLVLFARGGSAVSVLPLMSAYVVAGYKLLPALQRVFSALARMRGSQASIELMTNELRRPARALPTDDGGNRVSLEDSILLKEISFYYADTMQPALAGITMEIKKNTTVGIAGPTGCGKTTLVDVILGLHEWQSGTLRTGNTVITPDNIRAWRRNFGYVPQTIYLSDTSITRNIAFGVDEADIDHERVRLVSRLANLDQFIDTLQDGYETQLGERGVRLSGGQRQRIGIARALYRDPEVLIFDEATSALDTHTETAVMDAITRLMHQKTIIIIAHRLSTLRQADQIIVLKEGVIDGVGKYDDLKKTHPHFYT